MATSTPNSNRVPSKKEDEGAPKAIHLPQSWKKIFLKTLPRGFPLVLDWLELSHPKTNQWYRGTGGHSWLNLYVVQPIAIVTSELSKSELQ